MKRLVSLMLLFCMLACVPTPEQEIVINKGDGLVEDRIAATPVPVEQANADEPLVTAKPYIIPSHWNSDAITVRDTNVVFDADIITSGQTVFPIRKVQKRPFTNEDIEQVLIKMIPYAESYREGRAYTDEEYRAHIASLTELGMNEAAKDAMDRLQESERNAAEIKWIPISGTPSYESAASTTQRVYAIDSEKQQLADFYASTQIITISMVREGRIHSQEILLDEGSYEGEPAVRLCPKISAEEAKKTAVEFLTELGLDGFSSAYQRPTRFFDALHLREIDQGWSFQFVKSYEYFPTCEETYDGFNSGIFRYDDGLDYAPRIGDETILIYVGEKGVEYFSWSNPIRVLEVSNNNVELMPFEEMQRTIIASMRIGMQYIEKQQYPIMPNDLLYIDKVVLTTTVQQTKNERNTYYLMPVWMCYMRILDKETHELRNEGDYWVYCYNAIDGSRVRLS